MDTPAAPALGGAEAETPAGISGLAGAVGQDGLTHFAVWAQGQPLLAVTLVPDTNPLLLLHWLALEGFPDFPDGFAQRSLYNASTHFP